MRLYIALLIITSFLMGCFNTVKEKKNDNITRQVSCSEKDTDNVLKQVSCSEIEPIKFEKNSIVTIYGKVIRKDPFDNLKTEDNKDYTMVVFDIGKHNTFAIILAIMIMPDYLATLYKVDREYEVSGVFIQEWGEREMISNSYCYVTLLAATTMPLIDKLPQ